MLHYRPSHFDSRDCPFIYVMPWLDFVPLDPLIGGKFPIPSFSSLLCVVTLQCIVPSIMATINEGNENAVKGGTSWEDDISGDEALVTLITTSYCSKQANFVNCICFLLSCDFKRIKGIALADDERPFSVWWFAIRSSWVESLWNWQFEQILQIVWSAAPPEGMTSCVLSSTLDGHG